jgi:hypothetical protein
MVVAGGGGVSSMLITELSTYVSGTNGMLLSARCKTDVDPRWVPYAAAFKGDNTAS